MSVATTAQLKAEEIKPKIGSRVLNSKEELLSGEIARDIRDLLEARGVLVFPKIGFTDEEQIAFTKTLGTFAPERAGGAEEISKITLDVKENPSSAEYLKGSLYWHIDGTRNDVPILASLLSCKVPSPKGTGNTGFANTYSAYDDLPEDKKAEYEQYRVIHGPWASLFYYEPEPSLAKLQGYAGIGEQELPLVWKHQSGRKSLVIGCTAAAVVGKTPLESAMIIHGLRDWATGPEFTYSHEWDVGDLVMWDNTGTMHRAEAYDPTCGRMMHRTKLEGEEPFE
ncbi:TauD/TfdA dioxygenase family protein [Novosphingobium album (ex Liu et al. 2023)]|uniref:TauD/TfdA family dioxygenase n=1 Tax=Novosphingobium album (ex Liu et al. 2023) TaxID=3031130 RepID=A0ABT5WJA0_9SPHN|nr:TauD/TfdA family dioxygenase [Novosphingobium album (ex Liu et al. 2023)]MDE8650124.1 TauD/TfdA family dioxygenase [Novosphingobium album (ex Liu et al. 2023)]